MHYFKTFKVRKSDFSLETFFFFVSILILHFDFINFGLKYFYFGEINLFWLNSPPSKSVLVRKVQIVKQIQGKGSGCYGFQHKINK